jgi:hypothetical protein
MTAMGLTAVQRLQAELRQRYEKTARNFLTALGEGHGFIVVYHYAVPEVLSESVCVAFRT